MKKQFFAVRWGDTVRISEKVETPSRAAKDCYGCTADNMWWRSLGSLKSQIQKTKWLQAELKAPFNRLQGPFKRVCLDCFKDYGAFYYTSRRCAECREAEEREHAQ